MTDANGVLENNTCRTTGKLPRKSAITEILEFNGIKPNSNKIYKVQPACETKTIFNI